MYSEQWSVLHGTRAHEYVDEVQDTSVRNICGTHLINIHDGDCSTVSLSTLIFNVVRVQPQSLYVRKLVKVHFTYIHINTYIIIP